MSLKNVKVGKKILLEDAVPLILMIAIGIACALGITKLGDTKKQVAHTHNVIQQAMKIEAASVDMETGMRGYLLAGQEGFLDPYKNGGALFHKLIVDLQKIVNDNPKQVELLSSIEKVIDEWKEKVTEPTIQLRREIGTAKTMDDMADEVGLAKGKKYFDKFRGQIATFISREAKLMKDRQELALDKTEANEGINELIIQTTTWIEHTHLVIEQAMKVGAAAGDMETGMRGFLLAGKDEFLNPYQNGGKTFDDLIAQLKNEVIDNPAQVRLLGQISDNINSWKADVTEPAIKMRRDSLKTMDDVASLVGEAGGEKYFDKFRSQIATFISREKTLMIKRQKDAQDATSLSAYNRKLIRDTTGWVEHTHNVISQAMKIEAAAVDMETGMRGYLLAGQEDFLAPYNSGSKRFQELIAELSKTVVDNPGQVKLLSETVDNIGAWKSDVTEVNIALRRKIGDAKTMNDMAALVGEARGKKYFDDFRAKIKQFRDVEATLMVSRQESAENSANSTMMIIFGGTGAAIVLSLLSAFVLTRTITKPINEALVSANKLAEGDLTHIVEVTSKDEVGVLIGSMNASVNSLNGMLSQVEQTSNKIARGTTQ
ncbi:MAG: methyl-accepting chemotaxis protein, partial [Lentisphaeraceae bacterium]|nr:methyl-accepting chemotaxis protein [Lentisphaeraceae bacterium]